MSSFVSLQIGQCGVNIGQIIHGSCAIPQILIDTEPKVLSSYTSNKSTHVLKSFDGCGRANNWAFGYSDTKLIDAAMERIRLVAETCDCFMGSTIFHSIGGGTGSGVGSRIAEELKDLMPKCFVINFAVFPFPAGESPVQHFNSILGLSSLSNSSDAIVALCNNDHLRRLHKENKKVTLSQINDSIYRDIYPVFEPKVNEQYLVPFNGWSFVNDLAVIPGAKFIQQTLFSLSNIRTNRTTNKKPSCISSNVYFDTLKLGQFDRISQLCRSNFNTSKFNPSPFTYSVYPSRQGERNDVLCLYNSLEGLDEDIKTSSNHVQMCLMNKAYLHHYKRYLNEIEDLLSESLNDLNLLQSLYKNLTS